MSTTKAFYLAAVLMMMVLAAPVAQGQDTSLPAPGITPDSPLAFLDRWGEGLGLFFARGAEAKAAKQLQYAEERLAEAEVLAEEGKSEEAEEAADHYGRLISGAAQRLAEAAGTGEDTESALTDLVTKATGVHLTVLGEVYEKVPEQAKPAIERAIMNSARGQEAARKALNSRQREAVEKQVEEAEDKLDTLRQQGIPIPEIPRGRNGSTNSGRPTNIPAAGNASAASDQQQEVNGPPDDIGRPLY